MIIIFAEWLWFGIAALVTALAIQQLVLPLLRELLRKRKR